MNLPTCISSNRKIRYTVCFCGACGTAGDFFHNQCVCRKCADFNLGHLETVPGSRMNFMQLFCSRSVLKTFGLILLGGALALSGYLLRTFL